MFSFPSRGRYFNHRGEPVEVMLNDSHTYGKDISQVEREFLSMVDELLNLSNDDETFDPGGGENDVLLNNGRSIDFKTFSGFWRIHGSDCEEHKAIAHNIPFDGSPIFSSLNGEYSYPLSLSN
ncbi:hypothetical protein Tco_1123639 [Tanacetum coccineum]|uniref:Uncharacterized protein n=1 Tax=Tanacetum coccineum TaxID=301880 RepID=A0ABQ5J403_9ASTR